LVTGFVNSISPQIARSGRLAALTPLRGALAFGSDLRVTDHSTNPNTYGSIKAITPFIGDYFV